MQALRVFVASSSEQIGVAKMVAAHLNSAGRRDDERHLSLDARPWTEGTFCFSRSYIESLERELDRADFAVVILTADDTGDVRGGTVNLPRDNVIFELGLFMARLGRERCFFFVDATSHTKLASDLTGVRAVDFVIEQAAGPAAPDLRLETRCREVATQMAGLAARYKPSPEARAGQHDAWRFAQRVGGLWWSFRYWDAERIGLVELIPDESIPTVHVRGRGLSPETPRRPSSQWSSVVSMISRDRHTWTLRFIWEGSYLEDNKRFEGCSKYQFAAAADRPATGRGSLLETSLADLRDTTEKAVHLERCTEAETRVMEEGRDDAQRELVRSRLASWHSGR